MTEQAFTAEKIFTTLQERNELMLSAGRQTRLELLAAFERIATGIASSQEELADKAEVEWLSRLLRAQGAFTREVAEASGRFGRGLLETQ
jgi:hypothetical protein